LFRTPVTDIQNVYGDAKNDLSRSLVRFDKTLQEAGLKLMLRVDNNVLTILNNQDGISLHFKGYNVLLTASAGKIREILKWLSPEPYSDRYDEFWPSLAPSSGNWFLKSDAFQKWDTGVSNLFIISGMGTHHYSNANFGL